MTPTEAEAEFIALWQQGLTHEAMAQQLACPLGTVKSRLHTLIHQGKIQPRRAPAGHPRPPAQAPAPPPADSALPTREAPAITIMAVPEVQELIQTVKDLVARVATLEAGTREPTRDPPAPATHPRADIKQWTVRLSQALIEAVKAQATAEGKEPSHLVEELLWTALTDRRASQP